MNLLLLAFYSFGVGGLLGGLIQLLVLALVIIIVLWVVQLILGALGITVPPNIWLIIRVILALIVLLYALRIFGIA